MIKNIILINSANFNFLDVNLEKDLFFLGDNGSGKTTVIRAIHYLFSGDVRNLGIPTDKEGFKEYYFRYSNSYMIYVFEDFFIFMYKTGGEIVKLFSKQKFELERVVDASSNLYELDVIKRYAKEPNLKKTVKSLSDYREIIYGNNKQLLDFKFTSIRNSETFIGLFNEIFNIDKSIIDSKSIKQAIQTTLDYEKKVIDFNHEEYLQKIYEFQSQYKFFKEFEKQKENIENAYKLKETLLVYEDEIGELKEKIVYRVQKEAHTLSQTESKFKEIEWQLSKSKEMHKIKVNSKAKCEEKFRVRSNKLELEIQKSRALKEKYSQENIVIQRDRADKYEEILENQSELNQSYIKLKSGFENELDNINKEIKTLEYKKETELLRELDGKKFNQDQFLKNKLQEAIEKEELDFETRKNISELNVNDMKVEIAQFESDKKNQEALLSTLTHNQKIILSELGDTYEKKQDLKNKEIREKQSSIDTKERTIKNLSYDLEELERSKQRELGTNESSYDTEHQRLFSQIQKYQTMITSKPNSFKEFLSEEVDGWESMLYPILDECLLDKSIEELKPKLLRSDSLFSIELDKENLKHILTKDEADTKIKALELEKENLNESYKESLLRVELQYKNAKEDVEEKRAFERNDTKRLDEEIAMLREDIKSLSEELFQKRDEARKIYKIKENKCNQNIMNLLLEIKNNNEAINDIYKSIRADRVHVVKLAEELQNDYKSERIEVFKELDGWLRLEQKTLSEAIQRKEQEKHKITKDERVKQLENAIALKKEELSQSIRAKEFLSEYEKSKEEINSLALKSSKLENMKLKNTEFKKRLELKIENYEHVIDELVEAKKALMKTDKLLKKGAEDFERIRFESDSLTPKKSDAYLFELVEKYNTILLEYKNKKIDLKSKLDKINSLKNTQNEIEIHFNFEEYDSHLFISQSPDILDKIEDIADFKNKKLEMVKQNGHKKFTNFVKNLLPQKMSIFNDSENKFFSQVAKINKNLSEIDFGVIKNIKIDTKIGDKKSIAKLLNALNVDVSNLSSLLNESSLFYEKEEVLVELNRLEMKFKEIKSELKGNSISLQDTIDLSLSFNENGKQISEVSQLKNESSTGGSMLLKIAIAISILKLFITEDTTPFFLIVDEVSRLHSDNQEKLRTFANAKGFGIVFVTPEPTYSKPEFIKYYRFRKNADDEFEAIELNV
ncbi:hypothetical protein KKG72_06815 [bacterium]|nr:hypothetical protein [bacterium]MBU1993961.1 hypothetical protein [bacterium]